MSVASELPPDVYIPAGARTRALRMVSDPRFRRGDALGTTQDHLLDPIDVFAPAAPAVAANGAEVTDLDSWRPHYVGAQVGGRRRSVVDLRIRPEGSTSTARRSASVSAPSSSRVGSAPLRLTHRGAVALSVASVLLAIGVVAIAWLSSAAVSGGSSAGANSATGATAPTVVTVHSGDSLWSIASTIAPNRDPRVVVDDLRKRNHLDSDSVTPGQQLRVR